MFNKIRKLECIGEGIAKKNRWAYSNKNLFVVYSRKVLGTVKAYDSKKGGFVDKTVGGELYKTINPFAKSRDKKPLKYLFLEKYKYVKDTFYCRRAEENIEGGIIDFGHSHDYFLGRFANSPKPSKNSKILVINEPTDFIIDTDINFFSVTPERKVITNGYTGADRRRFDKERMLFKVDVPFEMYGKKMEYVILSYRGEIKYNRISVKDVGRQKKLNKIDVWATTSCASADCGIFEGNAKFIDSKQIDTSLLKGKEMPFPKKNNIWR
jgi:hypothetical protein